MPAACTAGAWGGGGGPPRLPASSVVGAHSSTGSAPETTRLSTRRGNNGPALKDARPPQPAVRLHPARASWPAVALLHRHRRVDWPRRSFQCVQHWPTWRAVSRRSAIPDRPAARGTRRLRSRPWPPARARRPQSAAPDTPDTRAGAAQVIEQTAPPRGSRQRQSTTRRPGPTQQTPAP